MPISSEATLKKHLSLHDFFAGYRSSLPLGDEIADLATDVLNDPRAPRQNARLIDYLLRRNVDGALIDRAITAWKKARAEAKAEAKR